MRKDESLDAAHQARFLLQALGERLAIIVLGRNDVNELDQWATGNAEPSPAVARRIGNAYRIVQRLRETESDQAIHAWFMGMNPELDDHSPAEWLAKRPRLVAEAADIFLATG
jgi:hypothetical protein